MEQKKSHLQSNEEKGLDSTRNTNAATQVIPVIEEHATVHKEVVETGKVHIKKTVTKEDVKINLPIINESYDIERIPISGQVSDSPPAPVRYEGDVMIIPVLKEITIVQKRYEIVEEIRVTKRTSETPLIQEITLHKENIHIQRTSNNGDEENLTF